MIDVGNGSATIFKFAQVGDTIEGVIATDPITEPQPEGFKDGKPFGEKVDKNGKVVDQWILTFERDDDEDARIYVSKWRMKKAIGDAVRKTGNQQIEKGAFLSVTRVADVQVDGARFPANAFEAIYSPPSDEQRAENAKSVWNDTPAATANTPF